MEYSTHGKTILTYSELRANNQLELEHFQTQILLLNAYVISFSWWRRFENLPASSLTNKRLSHSSAREVTAFQLLFRRLSLSSTKFSFFPKTIFKASPRSVTLFRWTFCFSISFCVACEKDSIELQVIYCSLKIECFWNGCVYGYHGKIFSRI